VVDSSKIRFWYDMWCEDQALKVAHPELFGIARLKDASMAEPFKLP
jgi:hypothetical protein